MAKPSSKFIIVIVLVILLGVAGLMYAMYSSSRNDADGAAERRTGSISDTETKTSSPEVSNKQESTKQTVSEVGQETKLKLYANSGTEPVNTVQTTIKYPADALQFVAVTNGTAFERDFATDTNTPGVIKVVRAVATNGTSVKGEQLVVTVTFKKLKAVNESTAVTVDKNDSYLVTSKDNRNLIGSSSASLTIRR